MKPYPAYKPSGVPWLGDVPEHWEVKRIRFMARLNPGATRKLDPAEFVSFLPMEAVGDDGSLKLELTRPVEEVSTGYTYFEDGDVTVAKITPCFENGKGANMQGLSGGVGFGTTELIVIRPSEAVHPQWLYLLTQSTLFRKRGEALMQGSGGQKRVPDGYIKDFPVAWPSEMEQKAIATHLDAETARIDTLVAEKEKLIGLLGEYRQSVITEAVTKGLTPNAPMKPSGVTWLGDVPAHWDILPLTKYVDEKADYRGKTPEKVEEGVFLVTAKNIRMGFIDYEASQEFVAQEAYEEIMRRGFPRMGDMLFTTEAPLGNVALVDREDIALAQRVIRFRMGERFHAVFTLYAMMSEYFQNQLATLSTGSTAKGLKASKLPQLRLVAPPPTEQSAIAAHLDTQTAKIDGLIAHVEKEIELLRELRSATITDAVLGRIDVRPTQELQGSPSHA